MLPSQKYTTSTYSLSVKMSGQIWTPGGCARKGLYLSSSRVFLELNYAQTRQTTGILQNNGLIKAKRALQSQRILNPEGAISRFAHVKLSYSLTPSGRWSLKLSKPLSKHVSLISKKRSIPRILERLLSRLTRKDQMPNRANREEIAKSKRHIDDARENLLGKKSI